MVGQIPQQKDIDHFSHLTKDFNTLFGINEIELKTVLPSERDLNFLAIAKCPTGAEKEVVMKVFEDAIDPTTLALRLRGLAAVSKAHPSLVQTLIKPLSGEYFVEIEGRFVAVVEFLPGQPLAYFRSSNNVSPDLLRDIGRAVGVVSSCLAEEFKDIPAELDLPDFTWDIRNFSQIVGKYVHLVAERDRELGRIVREQAIEVQVSLRGLTLPCQVCQNDANEYNIIVNEGDGSGKEHVGILDFGDLCYTYRVADLSICLAYLWLVLAGRWRHGEITPLVIEGFQSAVPLNEDEKKAIIPLAIARVCTSISVAARNISEEPDNHYHRVSQESAVSLMRKLPSHSITEVTSAKCIKDGH
ncbi:Homoserine Kinase [Perkinsus chesapeaki]|uniref:Hydroxylysine kinase n=1 Tax=Perkinsus chesapeaki TaxID=330153 RepID=A0A7J6KZA9_PERCH|nr:Homoserine Kinase [Perkinsus chesapeaki]